MSSSRLSAWYSSTDRMARSRFPFRVPAGGGVQQGARLRVAQRRRFPSLVSAFGRLTPRIGLRITALHSHR